MAMYSLHPKIPIKTWDELVAVERQFNENWAFRGQNTKKFPSTSLERHCKSIELSGSEVVDLEVKLIREFARRYHLYDDHIPPRNGHTLQWLALLQHYGAPTRLIDFTYSFFVSVYFAIEDAKDHSVVWAFDVARLEKEAQNLIKKNLKNGAARIEKYRRERDGAPFRELFMAASPLRFSYPANPIFLNERLTIQQGVFLAPGDVTTTFKENVREIPKHNQAVVRIDIDPKYRQDLLRKLHRLNINRATLFPGLEGFARSLRTQSLVLAELPAQGVDLLANI